MSLLLAFLAALAAPVQQAPGDAKRPQLPARPLPYDEVEVVIPATSRPVELAGTLSRPRGEHDVPAVILVQGGSPFDRDGTYAGHKPLLVLSDALVRAGLATLRLDDRGVGGSAGDKQAATLEELALDLEESVRFLRAEERIRPQAIGLLGYSGGALLCSLVASRDPAVAFVVLLGCPTLPLPALIAAQLAAEGDGSVETGTLLGGAAAEIAREVPAGPELIELVRARWRELVDAMPVAEREGAERFVSSMSRRLGFLLGTRYLHSVYVFDPAPALERIACPVLGVWGEYDQGRKLPNASAWELTRLLAGGACSSFRIAQVPRTNHFMQTCTSGALDELARIEETVSPEVLRLVVEWSVQQAVVKER